MVTLAGYFIKYNGNKNVSDNNNNISRGIINYNKKENRRNDKENTHIKILCKRNLKNFEKYCRNKAVALVQCF